METTLYEQWLDSCLKAGIPALSTDTAARILAVVYVFGGERESFVYNTKLVADIRYIKSRFDIEGCGVPPADLVELIKVYTKDCEAHLDDKPQWAKELFNKRYSIEL